MMFRKATTEDSNCNDFCQKVVLIFIYIENEILQVLTTNLDKFSPKSTKFSF